MFRKVLATYGTGRLMALRQRMLSLEECAAASEHDASALSLIAQSGLIFFKEDARWQTQYAEFKAILDTREHWPSSHERRERRRAHTKARR